MISPYHIIYIHIHTPIYIMHISSRLHCQNCDHTFDTYECVEWNKTRCRACKLIHRDEYYIEIIHKCPKCNDDAVHLVPDGSMLEDIRKVCRTTAPNDQDTFWAKLERKWWWAENEDIEVMILNTLAIYGDEAGMMSHVEEFLDQIRKGESLPDDDQDFSARF